MQNDVSGLMGHSASGNDLHNDIPPDLAFHEPEPVKQEQTSPRDNQRRSSSGRRSSSKGTRGQ